MDKIDFGSSVKTHSNCGPDSCIHTCSQEERECVFTLVLVRMTAMQYSCSDNYQLCSQRLLVKNTSSPSV